MDITIHRALSQLKTTKARITQKLHEDIYISSTIGKTDLAEGRPVAAVEREIQSNYDSMMALLKNYETLKLAIIRSNSGITRDSTNITEGDGCGSDCRTEVRTAAEDVLCHAPCLTVQ